MQGGANRMKDKSRIIITIMNFTLLTLALVAIMQNIKSIQIQKKIDNITLRLEQLNESNNQRENTTSSSNN